MYDQKLLQVLNIIIKRKKLASDNDFSQIISVWRAIGALFSCKNIDIIKFVLIGPAKLLKIGHEINILWSK